jgi:hypothetical protein
MEDRRIVVGTWVEQILHQANNLLSCRGEILSSGMKNENEKIRIMT